MSEPNLYALFVSIGLKNDENNENGPIRWIFNLKKGKTEGAPPEIITDSMQAKERRHLDVPDGNTIVNAYFYGDLLIVILKDDGDPAGLIGLKHQKEQLVGETFSVVQSAPASNASAIADMDSKMIQQIANIIGNVLHLDTLLDGLKLESYNIRKHLAFQWTITSLTQLQTPSPESGKFDVKELFGSAGGGSIGGYPKA